MWRYDCPLDVLRSDFPSPQVLILPLYISEAILQSSGWIVRLMDQITNMVSSHVWLPQVNLTSIPNLKDEFLTEKETE